MTSARKNTVFAVIIVGALGFSAYRFATFRSRASLPADYTVQGVCLACKAEAALTQSVRDRPPFKCRGCKANEVYPWFYCPTCKKRFVPVPVKRRDGAYGLPMIPICPGCGGTNGANYDPLDADQKGAEALPLPPAPK